MSLSARLAAKRQALVERTQAKRPTVNVTEASMAYRMYHYWLSHSNKNVTFESLCRFARVLVFWAPLYWLREKVLAGPQVGKVRVPIVASLLCLAAGIALGWWMPQIVITNVGISVYIIAGLVTSAYWLLMLVCEQEADGFKRKYGPLATLRVARLMVWLTLITLPVQILVAIVIAVFVAAVALCVKIFEQDGWLAKGIDWLVWFFNLHPKQAAWLRPWWVLTLASLGFLLYYKESWRIPAIILTIFIVCLITLIVLLAVLRKENVRPMILFYRSRAAKEAAKEAARQTGIENKRWERLFAEPSFQHWLWYADDSNARYFRSLLRAYNLHTNSPLEGYLQQITRDNMAKIENMFILGMIHDLSIARGQEPPYYTLGTKTFQPLESTNKQSEWFRSLKHRFTAFFKGVWEMLKLIGSAIWAAKVLKICPFIKFVPTSKPDSHIC